MVFLKVENLRKIYWQKGKKIEALKGISFEVRKGEIVAFLGPNGAGKTTTIKIISSILLPDGGDVWINGYNLFKHRANALRNIAVMLEGDRNLHFRLNAYENAEYFLNLGGFKYDKENFVSLAKRFGFEKDILKRQVRKYSKGMKQKLSLLITFLSGAPLILLDEPTLGLDVHTTLEMLKLIEEMKQDRSVFLTTHEMHIAEKIADRIIIIDKGKIIVDKPKNELIEYFRHKNYYLSFKISDGKEYKDIKGLFKDLNCKVLKYSFGEGIHKFVLDIKDYKNVYDLIEKLKGLNAEILELSRREPTLEEVYLRIVGGK